VSIISQLRIQIFHISALEAENNGAKKDDFASASKTIVFEANGNLTLQYARKAIILSQNTS
jgi:hypothetical protein